MQRPYHYIVEIERLFLKDLGSNATSKYNNNIPSEATIPYAKKKMQHVTRKNCEVHQKGAINNNKTM